MNIMLVCAGGMSTGILVNKIHKYAEDNEIELNVKAFGTQEYDNYVDQYDVVLLGPQISYKFDEIKNSVKLPVGIIPSYDYAIGNAESIIKQARELKK